jgi:hypothetical protein
MSEIHTILMQNGTEIATRDAWMMMHPGFNAGYEPGDLIELREGIFILDDDLVPGKLATREDIDRATRETSDG